MGLLGNSDEKQAAKAQKIMEKYGLDKLSPEYQDKVKAISQELAGMGLMETGMKLSFAKSEEQLKVSYLHAIFEQNWIIIRLLDDIAKK